jgi:hypothetical protein
MREIRTSSSMRGRRKRATSRRACALLYREPPYLAGRSLASYQGRCQPPSDAFALAPFSLICRASFGTVPER